ncbi:hypothetical protein FB562_1864 [Homoserinimonas aerilata]|uniref:Uncharacterized protein n=1 Tax=Homoserinimonas aerilata TaxID=1162970 RepID=A0A542YKZ1_9MICO|nr:hypothetical protein [Homoserinimonas aerilata]TQL48760.1 hypothetical protein FB562_1864 [Homoserinimonas aerilata]
MTPLERTRQQLDPVGAFSNRILTLAAALSAFLFVAVVVVSSIDTIANGPLAVMGLMAVGGASAIVVIATDPYRGPVTRSAHHWVAVLGVLATLLLSLSMWYTDEAFGLSWAGPAALGLLYIALTPYRPAREIVAIGGLATIAVGFITLLQVAPLKLGIPSAAVIAVVVMPLLALNLASAAFSLSAIHSLERWQRRARRAANRLSSERESGIARSVQQDRVTILNREVVPFLSEVLRGETIDDADRERARLIADAIRRVMVAEVDRT